MSHPSREELDAFTRKQVSDARAVEIAEHVRSCETCAQLASSLDESATRTAAGHDEAKTAAGVSPASTEPDEAPRTLQKGDEVGRYVVVSELGKGGMGAVYDAWDPVLDRRVALKLILASQGEDGSTSATARLEREARALARVSHPNAVAVFDAGRHGRQVFLAMERVEGETLRTWVKTPRTWRQVVDVLSQAGAGLKAVHDAGLVHRDFKPSNVVVTASGKAKVLDFGLARTSDAGGVHERSANSADEVSDPGAPMALERASLDSVTEEGSVSGTPGYIAPELFKGGPSTPASDQFAFGIALFQALYGRRPYPGRSLNEYYRALKKPIAREATDSKVPSWLWDIAMRCVASDPEKRFPSMAAVLEALAFDPGRKWRRAAIAALSLTVIVMAVLAGQRVEKKTCPTEAEAIEQLWPRSSRAAFHDQLLRDFASSKRGIDRAFTTIDKTVDEWARLSVASCNLPVKQQTAFEVQRAVCLKREEQTIRTVIQALQESEASVVARSDDVIDEMLENTTCADEAHVSRVRSDAIAGVNPELTRELRKDLMSAYAFNLLEKGDRALERSYAVVDKARDAGLPGFEGEAWYWIAMIEGSRGDQQGCVRDFEKSWQLALAAGDDENAFYSAAKVSIWMTERPETLGSARLMAGACEALWIRLGRDPRLETTLLDTKAWIAVADGDDQSRLALRERRAELTLKLYGENSREYAFAVIKVAAAKWELGMVHESNELEARALKLMSELRGPDDPALIYRAVSLGGGLAEEGRTKEAIAMLEHALERARKELEASDSTSAEIMIALADTFEHVDDRRGLALANEGVAWFEASKDSSSLAWALRTRARSLALNGKPKEALADCRRARTLDAQFHDPQKKNVRASFICEAEALEPIDAAASLAAWTSADELKPTALLAGTRARIAFGLARTQRATKKDPAKVRETAQRARKEYELLPSFTERLAAIDAFMATAK